MNAHLIGMVIKYVLDNHPDQVRVHLTELPARDMEHFMYREGFDDVYHRVAQLPANVPMNAHRVITKAIHRASKPDLAIEVAISPPQWPDPVLTRGGSLW